jgi:hypothetical protein
MTVLASGPDPQDVMISVFGASAGVAGLVLVFVGLLISTIGTYPGGTSKAVLRPYRVGAWAAIGVFAASLASVALSLAWLALSDSHWVYVSALVVFCALLLVLVILAVAVTRATV